MECGLTSGSTFQDLLSSAQAQAGSDIAEGGAAHRFLRFPGGCYVEGVVMANGFYWKPTVGPLEQRPGHWNGMWQYWSTDGEQPLSMRHTRLRLGVWQQCACCDMRGRCSWGLAC